MVLAPLEIKTIFVFGDSGWAKYINTGGNIFKLVDQDLLSYYKGYTEDDFYNEEKDHFTEEKTVILPDEVLAVILREQSILYRTSKSGSKIFQPTLGFLYPEKY